MREVDLEKLQKLGTWMYRFQLTDKITTELHQDWLQEVHDTRHAMFFPKLEEMFDGRWDQVTALDVACNEGYFGFEILRKGAKNVVGFDARKINIDKANFIKNHFDYKNIEFHVDNVYDLDPKRYGVFDIPLCLGLIYHLESPMMALRKIRNVTKKVCMVDTQVTKFNPVKGVDGVKTSNGCSTNIMETDSVLGLYDESDIDSNQCGSVTGLSCFPNKAAVFKMLKYAGFSEIIQLNPPPNAYEQYSGFERIMVMATV